jgi:uncharacterized protein YcfL
MKKFLLVLAAAILAGCASDPMMTGEAHDWIGHKKADLIAALGPPTKVLKQADARQNDFFVAKWFEGKPADSVEVLEYDDSGDTMSPKEGKISFGMQGRPGSVVGAHGGINTEETPAHQSTYLNVTRFEIRNDVVVKWYQSHSVDGVLQWERH